MITGRFRHASFLCLFLILMTAVIVAGCNSKTAATVKAPEPENGNLVAVTDQASQKIIVFDPNAEDWNSEQAIKWSWKPTSTNGFSGITPGWGLPSGVKLRKNDTFGGLWMVVTDSKGLAAIVPYPAGDSKKWALHVGGNPHEAELLPSGNIAVAASTGGWVRVYTSSQGPTSSKYAEYPMKTAHGVLWDPQKNVLWALGHDHLVALKVEGTPEAPTLKEEQKVDLPSADGHDLQPVYGNTDRLWVSTGSGVYQYVKSEKNWSRGFPDAPKINVRGIKSVGNLLTGQVVLTTPKKGCQSDWCTDTVRFVTPDTYRSRTGAAFYKARVWNPNYQ
ncbi:DUF6528 family protein [Paenibacillus allorhizosphaerae]|uniref:WD40 repeat domain-containing protein n=1 Tax=Paenibacillus allorhizosphaerae TaxID=2849866 RepID=A0ABM8VIH5_9BACL|nr:DUF6528 family protein [Paenibacillus allorhizosphaerae]CAG7644131.1 hypothetical protein PAECIP111802_03162 [Paenibacillus allorhizosphaerae]